MKLRIAAAFVTALPLFAVGSGELNHPTGKSGLMLIDKLGAHIRFFDPVTHQEISSIETPANPHDFVFSPDHKLAYVPIYGNGVYGRNPSPGHEVEIVDLGLKKITGVIDISPWRAPHGIQIDSAGTIYVTCDLDRKILVIDPVSRTIKKTIDTEGTGHWIAILPDGSRIYVANKNDKPFISVIDVKSGLLTGRIPTPAGTQGIAVSPDGSTVVAMDFAEPIMIVIDPKSNSVVDRVPLKGQTKPGYKAYFTPDGKRLLTMGNGATAPVHVFDAHSLRSEQTVLAVGKDPMGFAFSSDSKTALVANHGDGSVSIIDLESLTVTGNFHAGTGIETLSFY